MANLKLLNGKIIGDYKKPYIVAELNTSHFGDIEIAKTMITKASECGCDCVKFQSWSSSSLYSEDYYKKNPISKRVFNKFSLQPSDLKLLSEFSKSNNIDFASTPYSIDEAKFLIQECNVPYIKIASMELNNLPYLNSLSKLKVPLILSTGMGNIDEIKSAIKSIESTNDKLALLHCTSVYPSEASIIRLKNIEGLRELFPLYPIGYSDHSLGIEIPMASIALGACMIEKHFTLDKKRIGMDNQMATEPDEIEKLTSGCNIIFNALGEKNRVISKIENEQISKMRRSIVAQRNLKKGDILTKQDITYKRPGDGIEPSKYSSILGKVLLKDIKKDSQILFQDIQINQNDY